jgi:NADH-quinone oxidoreductase subunit M
MLSWTLYISFLGAAALLLLPRESTRRARMLALAVALAGFAFGLGGSGGVEPHKVHTLIDIPCIPALGIHFHLAVDGVSLIVVWLTGLAAIAGVLFSWNLTHRPREFFALFLLLVGGSYGVALSYDLFFLFLAYVTAITPLYFLIALWGSGRREHAAAKLALYSSVGLALVLVGIIAAFSLAGGRTTSLLALAHHPFPRYFQLWAFPVVFVGFGLLAGLWPFHTWAPGSQSSAPTAAAIVLGGILMNLGAYGCLRVGMTLFPEALGAWDFKVLGFSSWRDVFALLAVIGIAAGALGGLVQKDLKRVIGYSGITRMGFALLGLMSMNPAGAGGAVLELFSNGITTALLFGVAGRMLQDRTHTIELAKLSPLRLAQVLPFAAATFALATLASMGMPAFSGFVAEVQVLIGAWQDYPTLTVLAGIGILVGAASALRALQQSFLPNTEVCRLSESSASPLPDESRSLAPVSLPEKAGALLLLGATLLIGLYPRLLMDLIIPSFNSELFQWLQREGGWR